jgi:hypothetical protein
MAFPEIFRRAYIYDVDVLILPNPIQFYWPGGERHFLIGRILSLFLDLEIS